MAKALSHLLLQVPVNFLFGYHFQLSSLVNLGQVLAWSMPDDDRDW